MKTAGLLLAAGRSVRFGPENKLLEDLWGLPLVCHAARALQGVGPDRLFAITRDREVADLLPDFTCVSPDKGAADQSASIRAGVAAADHAGAERVLVVLGDMPCITPDHLKGLLKRSEDSFIVATTDGQRRMPPACFRRPVFDLLIKTSGDAGARGLLRQLPITALHPASPDTLYDVDRVDDLRALRMTKNALSSSSDR